MKKVKKQYEGLEKSVAQASEDFCGLINDTIQVSKNVFLMK